MPAKAIAASTPAPQTTPAPRPITWTRTPAGVVAAVPGQTTPAAVSAAFERALHRAFTARLVAYKVATSVYDVPSSSKDGVEYRVRRTGPGRFEWSCECDGANHPACMHRAIGLYAEENNFSAVRPQAPIFCANCKSTPVAVRADWCAGCLALKHAAEPIPFRPRATCSKCGMRLADPLHEAFCA